MPKSNLCVDKSKRRYDFIAGLLAGGFRTQHMTTKDISVKSGLPERTITERLMHPEEIRLKDLYKLADIAGVRITFGFKDVPE